MDKICEFCNKTLSESTLLRHIAKSKSCKSFYGPRFNEMKKEKGREKVFKFRYKTPEAHEKLLKQRRESYTNTTDLKEKNKEIYQKNKEKIREANRKERRATLSLIAKQNIEKNSEDYKETFFLSLFQMKMH